MFQFGDWVKIKYGEYEGRCAKVASRKKNGEYGLIFADTQMMPEQQSQPGSMISMSGEVLELLPPYVISQKQLRQITRAELTYADFAEHVFPPFNLKTERRYSIKVDDIRQALIHINRNKSPLPLFKQWFWLILNVFYDSLNIRDRYDETVFSDFPKDEKEIFSTVFGLTEKLYWRLEERLGTKEDSEQYMIRFYKEPVWEKELTENDELEQSAYFAVCSDIIGRVASYQMNLNKPQGQWVYSHSQMKHVISAYETDKDLEGATPEALALYRDFVRRLYREGDIQAIRILAWGYMEGGIAFRKNYELARMYMQELFDKTGDAFAANALGFLYYFGHVNQGIPDYPKAFQFFSYGVMDGVEESIYMAADMLIHGQGTVKNVDMGLNLLVDGYRNALYDFCRELFDCHLAEYAIYMGDCCLEGVIYGMGTKDAYRFYLEAQYAAEKRKDTDRPVDKDLEEKIERSLEYIRKKVGLDTTQTELKADFPIYISQMYEEHYPVKVLITKKRGTSAYSLKISRFDLKDFFQSLKLSLGDQDKEGDDLKLNLVPKVLVTYPELSWSGLISEMEYTLENCTILKQPDKPGAFLSDGFRRDEHTNALEFYSHGDVVAAIEADWYVVSVKKRNK